MAFLGRVLSLKALPSTEMGARRQGELEAKQLVDVEDEAESCSDLAEIALNFICLSFNTLYIEL